MLILAGAGSGKTRVLTHRIAYLVQVKGVSPRDILAFTFTNKAAAEMRERVTHLLGGAVPGIWVGTFHATCVRILRRDGAARGLKEGFSIYDTDDQEALVKRVLAELQLADDQYRPRQLLSKISSFKNRLATPADVKAAGETMHDENLAKIYAAYQKELQGFLSDMRRGLREGDVEYHLVPTSRSPESVLLDLLRGPLRGRVRR